MFSGIGLLVASRAKTIETVTGLMNLVMLPMWIVSGIFFSSERFPAVAQPFIKAVPLTPLIDSLRAVMLEGATLASQLPRIAIMVAWGVVCFTLALRWFRWDSGRATADPVLGRQFLLKSSCGNRSPAERIEQKSLVAVGAQMVFNQRLRIVVFDRRAFQIAAALEQVVDLFQIIAIAVDLALSRHLHRSHRRKLPCEARTLLRPTPTRVGTVANVVGGREHGTLPFQWPVTWRDKFTRFTSS